MDDGVAAMLRTLNDAFPAVEPMSAAEARAAVAARRQPVSNLDDAAAEDRVIDTAGGPIPVRIYRPHGSGDALRRRRVLPRRRIRVLRHRQPRRVLPGDGSATPARSSSRSATDWLRSIRRPPPPMDALRRVRLGGRPRGRTRRRPAADRRRRGQRGRQPGRGDGDSVPGPRQPRGPPLRSCSIR